MMDERLKILLDQLDAAWEMLDARFSERHPWDGNNGKPATLTDDEYFWEPVDDCWSLRPRGGATSPAPVGKGDWLLDEGPYSPRSPVTTITWRMCHICVSPLMRYDYTFGTHSLTLNDIEWPSTASDAIAFLSNAHGQWRNALETLSPQELEGVGRCDNPRGLDPTVRFIDLLA